MSFKRIDIINISMVIVIGLFIFMFSYPEIKYIVGWLVGGLAGMVYFWLIRYSLSRPLVIKSKRYKRCKIARFAMMAILFILSVLFPSYSNVICVLLGFLVNKVAIVIAEGFRKGSVKNGYVE